MTNQEYAVNILYQKLASMASAIGGLADDAVLLAYKANSGKKQQKDVKPLEPAKLD